MYCIDCKEFVCELCLPQDGKTVKHSPCCRNEIGPKHLPEVSLYVVKSFQNELDEITLLRDRLSNLITSNPFAKENEDIRATAKVNTLATHNKIYRQGCDLIENVFAQLR